MNRPPKAAPVLTVVFVSYGSLDMILNGHQALLQDGRFAIKIVENDVNAPAEGLPDLPHVELIRPRTNLGYARAANLVLKTAETSRLLLLNPDVQAPVSGILELLEAASGCNPPPAAAGPASHRKDHVPGRKPHHVVWISGCAMLLDVAAIREVGMFDENIFIYSEDTELCQRIAAQGKPIIFCPSIYFPHNKGSSTISNPELERLRWWHFGWSNCYRMTKHGSATFWKNPHRKMLSWRVRSWLARSARRRDKWRAKADGAAAFLRGEQAFDASGQPKESPPR